MARFQFAALAIGAYLSLAASPLVAGIQFDQDVTNNVIFGTGNANGGFTTDRRSEADMDVELGLRAKVRFPTPENTFLSQGDGTYGSFSTGGPGGPTPNWSFEWSINTDYLGNFPLVKLDSLTYEIRIDSDPTFNTSFLTFDPINQPYVDSAIGNNSTANGAGTVAANPVAYAGLIGANNLAQNSWRMDFFFPTFNPNLPGTYTIELQAFNDEGSTVGFTSINVVVGSASGVPEASSLLTWAGLAAGFGLVIGWRNTKSETVA